MKLLIIRNSWKIGGAELYWVKLADAFVKFHIDCKIILITNNKQLTHIAKLHNIEAHIVNTFGEEVGTKRGLLRLLLNLPNYLWQYLRVIDKLKKATKPDIVILSGKTEKYVLTAFFKSMNLPVIWLEHGQVFTPTMAREALSIYKFMSQYASKILAEAHDAEMDLVKNGIKQSKIQYIGSGIDIDHFSPDKNKTKKHLVVGFMATIDWEKGIKDYLKTAVGVCKNNKTIKFLVLGDGPQLSWAKKFVKNLKLTRRVKFVGHQENIKKYLTQMSILLSPINFRGALSLSMLEAMSMGVIPIVTDIGGNRELVINGTTGYIFSQLYKLQACRAILKLSKSRNLMNKISLAARQHIINNFSDESLANRWHSILLSSISINKYFKTSS